MRTEILPHSICPHGSHMISSVVTSSAITGDVGSIPTATAAVQRSTDANRRTGMS